MKTRKEIFNILFKTDTIPKDVNWWDEIPIFLPDDTHRFYQELSNNEYEIYFSVRAIENEKYKVGNLEDEIENTILKKDYVTFEEALKNYNNISTPIHGKKTLYFHHKNDSVISGYPLLEDTNI